MSRLGATLLLAAAAAGAACATTPRSRADKNRAVFDALPQAQQQAVLAGRVEPGMTPEAAQLALGAPDRVFRHEVPGGPRQEVWLYGAAVPAGGGVSEVQVPWGWEPVWGGSVVQGPAQGNRFAERSRVVFENGRVVAVESRRR